MPNIDTHKVALKFFNFDCTPYELTKQLAIEPTETALKGQDYYIGPKHKRIKKIWPWNFWMYQVVVERNRHSIVDQIDEFIDNVIKPRQEKIKEIVANCDCEISIVQIIYEGCNPGLHLDNGRLKILTDIGAEIDVDIYVLDNGRENEKEE